MWSISWTASYYHGVVVGVVAVVAVVPRTPGGRQDPRRRGIQWWTTTLPYQN